MSEIVSARSFLHEGYSIPVQYLASTPLEAGGNEKKAVIAARVGGAAVSFIERPYDQAYVSAWKSFHAAGMPVVPTMRAVTRNSEDYLLVTDVKADGSEVYGKGMLRVLEQNIPRERPRPEADAAFLEVTRHKHFADIEESAHEYIARANKNFLRIPYDGPFELVVHPNGTWSLVMLDLRLGDQLSTRAHPSRLKNMEEYNNRNVRDFLAQLQLIRRHLAPKGMRKIFAALRGRSR